MFIENKNKNNKTETDPHIMRREHEIIQQVQSRDMLAYLSNTFCLLKTVVRQ